MLFDIMRFQNLVKSQAVIRFQLQKESRKSYYFLDNETPEKHKAVKLDKCSTIETLFAYSCKNNNGKKLLFLDFSS